MVHRAGCACRPGGASHQRHHDLGGGPAGGDRGQVLPLGIAIVVLAAIVMMALVPLAQGADASARAQAAADAAALAGAAEGEGAARAVAEANGAELVHWLAAGTDVWVQVHVGDAEAVAQARRE